MKKSRFGGKVINKMQLKLPALSANEGMARAAVAAFCAQLDPAAVEIADVKCAVSEAVTNAIVHAYKGRNGEDKILIECAGETTDGYGGVLHIKITDFGCGIENVEQALKPFFTTLAGDERSGMGFTIMESFMTAFEVNSAPGKGTTVHMRRKLQKRQRQRLRSLLRLSSLSTVCLLHPRICS